MSDRRTFLQGTAALGISVCMSGRGLAVSGRTLTDPLAIVMWDFSWLERRWPGAGYEDWDLALDDLKQRGYDAVRIDAFPHFVAADPEKEWELIPCWNQEMWGSPAINRVRVQPHLNEFIRKSAQHDILVAFSTWWRQDSSNIRMRIKTPQDLAEVWRKALDNITRSHTLDRILYVDLSNEFCIPFWTPWLAAGTKRHSAEGARWMHESIAHLKQAYPNIACTFSFTDEKETWRDQDVAMLDFLVLHSCITSFSDFYERLDYHFEQFDPKDYNKLQQRAESLYRSDPAKWQASLDRGIDQLAEWSPFSGNPLITTECWGVVHFKDWPLLNWAWVKQLCEIGVRRAAGTGRWSAMAASTFR